MECLWTRHAEERQQEWQTKLGVTREEVEEVLRHPEQIVAGDQSALIAQSRRDDGLLRVPFLSVGEDRKILTVYWTSRIGRYQKDR
jgi:Domain of unknown function (DUF4258)